MKRELFLSIVIMFSILSAAQANTYVVLNNLNNGVGSLRSAINDANNHAGKDTIVFNIPDGSVASRTISLTSHLPALNGKLVIDATTQTKGANFGTSFTKIQITTTASLTEAFDLSGDSCELYGFFINNFQNGIYISGKYSRLGAVNKGNVIYKCTTASINIVSTDHVIIISNVIGLDTSQNLPIGTYGNGIEVVNSYAVAIGGHSSSASNIIGGNNYGIKFDNSAYCDVNGNFIGTDATGNVARPNSYGIRGTGLNSYLDIGGDSTFEKNVISGNTLAGIYGSYSGCIFRGNFIGVKLNGTENLGNGSQGIYFSFGSSLNTIGGLGTFEGNVIGYNGQEAIYFINSTCSQNTIRRNITFCNSQQSGNGGFKFSNGNGDINPPTLSIANALGVNGTTYANGNVDLYQDDDCSFCEGKILIASITADANGLFSYLGALSGKITATVTDIAGNTSEYAGCIVPDNPNCMIAKFTSSGSVLCTETDISFIDQTIVAPGTYLTSWSWDFGDGNTANIQYPLHQYLIPGTYVVQLIATNNEGCSDTTIKSVLVSSPPVANFTLPENSCVGNSIAFNDASNPGGGATLILWNWEFGDGETSTSKNAIHVYAQTGNYTITLSVTNSNGCTDTYTKTIGIYNQPIAGFTYNLNGQKVYFTNTSIVNEHVSYLWIFGDGGTSGAESPNHKYSIDGLYNVCLVVYDSVCATSDTACSIINLLSGISETDNQQINISPNPSNQVINISGINAGIVKSISVYDYVGRKVIEQLKTEAASDKFSLDVSHLPEGVYMLLVHEDAVTLTKKFSVVHY